MCLKFLLGKGLWGERDKDSVWKFTTTSTAAAFPSNACILTGCRLEKVGQTSIHYFDVDLFNSPPQRSSPQLT